MSLKRAQKIRSADTWMGNIKPAKQKAELVPVIGVTIECRIVVKNAQDWDYIRETLDNCRCYGAAEVVDTQVFDR